MVPITRNLTAPRLTHPTTSEKGDQWVQTICRGAYKFGDQWEGNQWDGGPMRWGANDSGGPMRWGTNEMGGAWVLIGGPMKWDWRMMGWLMKSEMGDQWDWGLMRWGTNEFQQCIGGPMSWGTNEKGNNEMGDQWADPVFPYIGCVSV